MVPRATLRSETSTSDIYPHPDVETSDRSAVAITGLAVSLRGVEDEAGVMLWACSPDGDVEDDEDEQQGAHELEQEALLRVDILQAGG